MTAAPHSPLVERVAIAMLDRANALTKFQSTDWEAYLPLAQAALDACRAEEMLVAIRGVVDVEDKGRFHPRGIRRARDEALYAARTLLAKLDG